MGDKMDIDVRSYIINNFKGDSEDVIGDNIDKVVSSREDEPLIGLGVLFEILWDNSDKSKRSEMVKRIKQGMG